MATTLTALQNEERYSRQSLAGWRQDVLRASLVLVVGAGALGNEVLKNLALIGIGFVDVMDFDRVEQSNLSRCVLFREGDLHRRKVHAAAERLRELSPNTRVRAIASDVRFDVGAGTLRGYDLVLGCVDNIEARLTLGRLCRDAGVVYLDGGMDAHGGQVSLFHPNKGACFECGMTASMWARVQERQSCLRMGSGEESTAVPMAATAVMASSIGALQAQEAVRYLLRDTGEIASPLQPGQKVCLQSNPYGMFVVSSSVSEACAAHQALVATEKFMADTAETTAVELLDAFGAASLSLAWDVVMRLECMECCTEECVLPLHRLTKEKLQCPRCGRMRLPEMQSTVARGDSLATRTLAELGIPSRAVVDLLGATKAGERERIRVELV